MQILKMILAGGNQVPTQSFTLWILSNIYMQRRAYNHVWRGIEAAFNHIQAQTLESIRRDVPHDCLALVIPGSDGQLKTVEAVNI
jgi:hypothetical protein